LAEESLYSTVLLECTSGHSSVYFVNTLLPMSATAQYWTQIQPLAHVCARYYKSIILQPALLKFVLFAWRDAWWQCCGRSCPLIPAT
jgi:hypothetical protein